MTTNLAALLLADGRFPAGGHVHSAGVESAIADGRVHDDASLTAYVIGRLWTAGLTDAALAVATTTRVRATHDVDERAAVVRALDAEADARIVSPVLRSASRRLGRQLLRAAGRCWPSEMWVTLDDLRTGKDGLHQACAWGLVGVAAELGVDEVARLMVHHATSTPAMAAVRLLGLDPFAVAAMLAACADDGERVVDLAVGHAWTPLDELPAGAGPVVEIASMEHARWDIRMFTT